MNSQRGFTLIEALSAGLISTIVAGAMLTVFSLTTRQLGESTANLTLGQIQSIVSEQVRRDARKAFGPKSPVEDLNAPFDLHPEDDPAMPGLSEVYFCGPDGAPFNAYRFHAGYLEEWDAMKNWTRFKIGNRFVQVDAAASDFNILSGRAGVTFRIVCQVTADRTYASPLLSETVMSRNN